MKSLLAFLCKYFAFGSIFLDCTGQPVNVDILKRPHQNYIRKNVNRTSEQDQQPLQSALPPKDEYLVGTQTRQMLVIEDNSSLLTPLTIDEPEWKETFQMKKQWQSTTDTILEGEALVSQVTPLLGTTPSENTQIQHRNTPEDISDILGTRVYQRYVDTPLQTLDGIIVNQPKWFLPLAEEAKRITEEIRIEKINELWAGIPHQQLLNQSFNDQLNLIQILEQLAPLQLAK